MPAPAWENLDDFLSTDEFAVELVAETQAGVRTAVGIFDDPYLNAQLGEYELDSSKPRFLGKEVDLAGIERGDLADIITRDLAGNVASQVRYAVLTRPQPDGTGMALVELAKV